MEAVIFIGIQATGKSSFYRERFFHSHVRVNRDMLRTRHRERLLIDACIAGKQAFVVDNTNPTPAERQRTIVPARAAGFRVVGYFFKSAIVPALARNAGREGAARIPERGIRGTRARLVLPSLGEGFDALYFVEIADAAADAGAGLGFRVEEWRDEV
ncbi:MAG: AAA family ATPase [Myxococcales bacterium]|nr:AAA family ATPase [Myxococcales bacterium]